MGTGRGARQGGRWGLPTVLGKGRGLLGGLPGRSSVSAHVAPWDSAALCPAGLTIIWGVASDTGSWPRLAVVGYLVEDAPVSRRVKGG